LNWPKENKCCITKSKYLVEHQSISRFSSSVRRLRYISWGDLPTLLIVQQPWGIDWSGQRSSAKDDFSNLFRMRCDSVISNCQFTMLLKLRSSGYLLTVQALSSRPFFFKLVLLSTVNWNATLGTQDIQRIFNVINRPGKELFFLWAYFTSFLSTCASNPSNLGDLFPIE